MVRESLLDSNQNGKKWCCTAETSDEVYICKLDSALDNTSTHFTCYEKFPELMKPEVLAVASTQLPLHPLNIYMIGNKKDYSWVILTAEQQLNFGD